MKSEETQIMRHSQARDWADICDQREPGTGSRAGAFIPNIETSLIKYCSHPGRDKWCCHNWPDDLMTLVMTCACPGQCRWRLQLACEMRWDFHFTAFTMWILWPSNDIGQAKCCKNMTKCPVWDDLRQWGLWAEEYSAITKSSVLWQQSVRDRPRLRAREGSMRKTWE